MRIQGRQLRPSNLAERRVLKSLGTDVLRVPRKLNPFAVARHIRKSPPAPAATCPSSGRCSRRPGEAVLAVCATPTPVRQPVLPVLPDSTSEPREAVAA